MTPARRVGMKSLMKGLMKKSVMAILGVVLMLGWWSIRGWFEGSASAGSSHIPSKIWEGGGGPVTIEVESSEPGRVSASFETHLQPDDPNHKFLESWEKVDAGKHRFTIDIPPNVGGTVEMSVGSPQVGSTVHVSVRIGERLVAEDSSTLDAPLQPGYGFFAQVHLDDYATGKLGED
jgi:hypothetical protein